MSEKKKQSVEEALPQTMQQGKFPKPCVYCGPTIKGVVRQYTVYYGELPEALAEFIHKHPEIRNLLVGMERFAEVRKALNTSGTAEAILFQKIKNEL